MIFAVENVPAPKWFIWLSTKCQRVLALARFYVKLSKVTGRDDERGWITVVQHPDCSFSTGQKTVGCKSVFVIFVLVCLDLCFSVQHGSVIVRCWTHRIDSCCRGPEQCVVSDLAMIRTALNRSFHLNVCSEEVYLPGLFIMNRLVSQSVINNVASNEGCTHRQWQTCWVCVNKMLKLFFQICLFVWQLSII